MASHEARKQVSETRVLIAAIDTSSDRAGVALFDGDDVSVLAWNAHRHHTVDTLAQLDHLMRLAGLPLHQLDGVAVSTGPGSFSALRVGLSIAKGLAFSLGVPVMGVRSTMGMAASIDRTDRTVLAAMPAGRGRVVWEGYQSGNRFEGPSNSTVDELVEAAARFEALVVSESVLPSIAGAFTIPAGARVEQIARIGWMRLRAGERDDPALLEPIYVHGRRAPEAMPA